jgi:hypothetical protein
MFERRRFCVVGLDQTQVIGQGVGQPLAQQRRASVEQVQSCADPVRYLPGSSRTAGRSMPSVHHDVTDRGPGSGHDTRVRGDTAATGRVGGVLGAPAARVVEIGVGAGTGS